MLEMKAARWWGVEPPTKFYEYSRLDQAIMVELYVEEQQMTAYQAEVDRLEQEKSFSNLQGRRKRGRRK